MTVNSSTGIISETVTASWTAADADGDDLVTSIYFSADAGETWEPVAINLEFDITVTAADSDANTSSHFILLYVGQRSYLPFVLKE